MSEDSEHADGEEFGSGVPSTDVLRAWEAAQLEKDREAEDVRILGEVHAVVRKRSGKGSEESGCEPPLK